MEFDVSMPLLEAIDECWHTLAECFEPDELLMKEDLVKKYYPTDIKTEAPVEAKTETLDEKA